MADNLHYVPGDYYQIDDRTGFKIRASTSRMQWNNLVVSPIVYEPRQPQDFVRGVVDNQTVPIPRPRQTNQFIQPTTQTQSNFAVYGGSFPAAGAFLVMNQNSNIGYDPGINAESGYLNTDGTAEFQSYDADLPIVSPDDFPSNIS